MCLALPTTGLRGGELIAPPDTASKGSRHWAFQPLGRPQVPTPRSPAVTHTAIDTFLLSRLQARGLTFSPEAGRETLIRRAYLDLWGLPPGPAEVDAFLADRRPDAWERLVDRLLASPHFGERWGRHWLDVVGYADTVGFDTDANNIILSEGKWRYRDYVISSFNRDKPYDRFVTEQLAGDELVDWRNADHFTPPIRELLIATGYLRTARDLTHEPESNIPLNHFGVLHDTVAIVGNSLLGLTLACAQCHDHKFDPITQKDYYRLMAAFTPAYNPTHWKPVFPWKPDVQDRGLPDVSPTERARIDRHNAQIDHDVTRLKQRLSDIRRPTEDRLRTARLQELPQGIRDDTRKAIATPPAKRDAVQKYLAEKLGPSLHVSPEQVSAALSPEDRKAAGKVAEDIATLERGRRRFGKLQALYDVGPPPRTFLLKRGDFKNPGREVEPGFPEVLCSSSPHSPGPAAGETSGRRKALADWLTAPDSRAAALLSRVMVNRIWQHLFGKGIVATPENFGTSGQLPTHPELLEWLSGEYIRGGWRIKPMIRLLMTSAAYRQASAVGEGAEGQQVDPGNHLLWHMPLRRLEAEAIRDSILAISGRLNDAMGGPPILLHARADGMVVIDNKVSPPRAADRRSVYLLSRRAYNLSLLTVFDQPLVAINCPCRDTSAVPLQSLTMKNDAFIAEQARHFARRVAGMAAADQAARTAFRLALVRTPTAAELAICTRLLAQSAATYRQAGKPPAEAEQLALTDLCHTLLNTSEFLYVE